MTDIQLIARLTIQAQADSHVWLEVKELLELAADRLEEKVERIQSLEDAMQVIREQTNA